ncbi:MAG: hypothetical protein KDE27_23765 [Planctomycetes bacterium]|nr:hypothetical protein [Planctomycetota bacterium]
MRIQHTLAAAGLLCAALSAQYTAHPLDNLNSGVSQNIPIAGNSASWDEARSQFLFRAQYLPPIPALLNGIEWVPNTNGTTTYERFEIWVDHTQNSTLSTTFAANLSANPTLVFSASPGSITWTGAQWTPIVFTTPFVYDGQSNLVVEIRKQINRIVSPPPSISHRVLTYPRRNDLGPPIWAWGAYGSGAVDATTAQTTYNTELLTRLDWLGAATLNVDSTRDTTGNSNRSYFHIGATATFTTQSAPNEFYVQGYDFALQPVPLPIPGFSGGLWLLNPVALAGFLDGSGFASQSVALPSDPGLIGITLYAQSVILGTTLTFSNIVDGPIAAY